MTVEGVSLTAERKDLRAAPPKRLPNPRKKPFARRFGPYLLYLPAVALVVVFTFWPILRSIIGSFTDSTLIQSDGKFVGLQNYVHYLDDSAFWQILLQTVFLTVVSVAGSMVLGTSAAILLRRPGKVNSGVRSLLLIPWIAPPVVTAFIWAYLYRDIGPISSLLQSLGITHAPVDFLNDTDVAIGPFTLPLLSVTQVAIWAGFPFVFLFTTAALTGIPAEIYEAAQIDGAGGIRMLTSITLPMIAPVLETTALLLGLIRFGGVDLPVLLTNGGPNGKTNVFGVEIYNTAFASLDSSKAAALGVLVFALMLPMAYLYVKRSLRQMAG